MVRGAHSTFTCTLPVSAALGTVRVRTPSDSFAETLLVSTGCGSSTVRVKLAVPANVRSVVMAVWSDCGCVATEEMS